MEYIRSVLAKDIPLTTASVYTYDLPVNPLSHILYTLGFANNTTSLVTYSAVETALSQISKVEVLYRGQSIISGSLADLARGFHFLTGWAPGQTQQVKDNNALRSITVPLCLGRIPYHPAECFPESKKGELQMQVTVGPAQTGIKTLTHSIETVELPEATPEQYTKLTTHSLTPSATGDVDIELPIGHKILGMLLYSTLTPSGSSSTATIQEARLMVDNTEAYVSKTRWATLRGEAQMRAPMGLHCQEFNAWAPASVSDAETLDQETGTNGLEKYAYIDLDPLRDGSYALDTAGKSRVNLRITAGDVSLIRCLPVELVAVKK